MSITDITQLQETSPGNWQAKYRGNYGVYTIKIRLVNGEMNRFSCSCPSDGYPCKHIPMVLSAIKTHQSKSNQSVDKDNHVNTEKIIRKLSHKKLEEFILKQLPYNPALNTAILLEFAHTVTSTTNENPYNAIFRRIFSEVEIDDDNYDDYYDGYNEDTYNLDELDDWFEKARKHIVDKNYEEAEAIYKAIIEEFGTWANSCEAYELEYISVDYSDEPFDKLKEMADDEVIDADRLFEYCFNEIEKEKYRNADVLDNFYDLMQATARSDTNKSKFIAIQYDMVNALTDKSSYDAQKILTRLISFYQMHDKDDSAWEIMEKNLQIESFRQSVVEKRIRDNQLSEAKQLIQSYLNSNAGRNSNSRTWNELLLKIAKKENDTKEIRRISYIFIQSGFDKTYYRLYKATFPVNQWSDEMERLISAYQKERRNLFSYNIGDLLVEEKDDQRLLDYTTRHCSAKTLESYYKYFVKNNPAETLRLFKLSIEDYAKSNLGREHYEYIVQLMKIMQTIEGGNETVAAIKMNFRNIYKNRRAMMEILEKIK